MPGVRTSLKKTQLTSVKVHWKSDLSARAGHLLVNCDPKHNFSFGEEAKD